MNRLVEIVKVNKDRIIKGAIVVGSVVAGAAVLAVARNQQENVYTDYENVIDVTNIVDDYEEVETEPEK